MMNDRDDSRLKQLWGEGELRVFISHKAENEKFAKDLKTHFYQWGIASFVAHEDIEPLKEWQSEIEKALFSMDGLVALMTDKFSESDWTDQEIGVAVGRGVPIFPIHLGKDPYGFISKYQAIPGAGKSASSIATEIFTLFLSSDGVIDNLKNIAKDSYILAVSKAGSFDRANYLSNFLTRIDELSHQQAEDLVKAFNENSQVRYASDFRPIIATELNRMTGKNYVLDGDVIRLST